MRKPLIAGNWKMHGTKQQASALIQAILKGYHHHSIDVVVCPAFVHLDLVQQACTASDIHLGAQNLYINPQGAFTGEVAGPMLSDLGCRYVLVGHSERRTIFQEDLDLIAAKFNAALTANLTPILCVGETQEEREKNQTESIITNQIQSVIDLVGIAGFKNAVIAYEPVWAIGTGLTATPTEADAVHHFIRQLIAQNNVAMAETIRILYGGSMKPENAHALLSMPNIDGGLIGGASLNAEQFLAICQAAIESGFENKRSA
ncbi:MAG: triose-phosphate isomerase [Gammaproteobacteria bacterium]|nr:triose-phosphate isomerase [Gammaproteobacteria bacterium]